MSALLAAGPTLIKLPTWGTVSLIEALWTLAGALAILVVLPNLRQAVLDSRSTRGGDPALSELAAGYREREFYRLFEGVDILAIGIYADVQAQPSGYVTIAGLVITVGLLALGGSVAAISYRDRRRRRRVTRLLAT